DEPKTPVWVPAVGLAIFFVVIVAWLVRGSGAAAAGPAPEAQVAAPPVQQTAPQPPPPSPVPPASGPPIPSGLPSAGPRPLTPDQARDLQKRIDEMKQRRGGAPGPVAPAPAPRR